MRTHIYRCHILYFCTSKASKLSTCAAVSVPQSASVPYFTCFTRTKVQMLTPVYMCPHTCATDASADCVTCFTSTKVQMLTPVYMCPHTCATVASADCVTCCTSTKVQMLTPVYMCSHTCATDGRLSAAVCRSVAFLCQH
jgi:hypothetical protein